MLFVLEATKIDHHWSSLKQDGALRRRILAPAVAVSDFRSAATREHAEQIKEPLQSANAHWCTVFYQLGGLDDLEAFLKWGTARVFVRSTLLFCSTVLHVQLDVQLLIGSLDAVVHDPC
jgi:hypothetical protein